MIVLVMKIAERAEVEIEKEKYKSATCLPADRRKGAELRTNVGSTIKTLKRDEKRQ
ncbi:MAG TPA: hypothetical protein VIH86_05890 [Puia sp.]|jgi:hypothetical protein